MTTQPTVMRKGSHGQVPTPLVDFRPTVIGDNPVATQRIMGLVAAGHSYRHIREVGHYQGAWSESYLNTILSLNRVVLPGSPYAAAAQPQRPVGKPLRVNAYERAVLAKVCAAWSNDEIAVWTATPETRVKSTIRTLVKRADARDRIALVVAVLTHELNPVDEADHDA